MTGAVLASRPGVAVPAPWSFPSVERFRLGNGMTVLALHMATRPVLACQLILGTAARREPPDRFGVASVTGLALMEGTADHSGPEFHDVVERNGASLTAGVDWAGGRVGLSVPVGRLRPALGLLADLVRHPGFRDDDVARTIGRCNDQVAVRARHPEARVQDAFAPVAFGAGRMVAPLWGRADSLAALTPDAVRRFWADRAALTTATLIVVGNLAGLDLAAVCEQTLGEWVPTDVASNEAPPAERPAPTGRWVAADFPDAVQTRLLIGHALDRVPPEDRAALDVAVSALGGYFSSRLMRVLREELGITYGVQAQVDHRDAASVFIVQTSVQSDATGVAVEHILAAVEESTRTLDDEEAHGAADRLARLAPMTWQSPAGVADRLARLVLEGLPDDYYARWRARLAEVTAADAVEAFARWIEPERLAVVAAGAAARLGDRFEPAP